MIIPRKIHQIWFQGAQELPEKYSIGVAKMKGMNPGWEHHVWDHTSLRRECAQLGAMYAQAYDTFDIMHQKIDFGRYCVLLRHGGISVDMDVTPMKPFDSLPFLKSLDRLAVTRLPLSHMEGNVSSRGDAEYLLNNATLLCPPNDPALRIVVDAVASADPHTEIARSLLPDFYRVLSTTGPTAITRILSTSVPKDLFVVLKPTYFEPCLGQDPYCKPSPRTTVLYHHHDSSWHPFSPLIKVHMYIRPYFMHAVLSLCAGYLAYKFV